MFYDYNHDKKIANLVSRWTKKFLSFFHLFLEYFAKLFILNGYETITFWTVKIQHLFLLFPTHCPIMIFLQMVNYSVLRIQKSIVMNDFLYTLKFDNSPCGEISTSPTQRCVLQTCSHTSHESMFRWRKCFKEARTKTVLSSHCTYNMFLHILKG